MPVMDGFKATEEILKLNPNDRIIAQTAYAMSSDRQKCFESGFCDYISKPIKKDELLSMLLKWQNDTIKAS